MNKKIILNNEEMANNSSLIINNLKEKQELNKTFNEDIDENDSFGEKSIIEKLVKPFFENSPSYFNKYLRPSERASLATLANILEIKTSKELNKFDFYEFGSRNYTLPNYGPFSSAICHLLTTNNEINYYNFDPETKKELFTELVKPLREYIENKEETIKVFLKWIKKHNNKTFKIIGALKFVSRNEELFESYTKKRKFSKQLPNLIDKLNESTKNYSEIEKLIQMSEQPIIFSNNVLNYPKSKDYDSFSNKGLDFKFPFWKINKGIHIHRGSLYEIMKQIGYSEEYSEIKGRSEPTKENIEKFKEFFEINHDVKYVVQTKCVDVEQLSITLFWDANK